MDEQLIQQIVAQVMNQLQDTAPSTLSKQIPIAVSARHVHLKEAHIEQLFGKGYKLTPKFELSQPGQFAAEEQVTIVGSKGALHKVRILGPARDLSQVEVSATDARQLGIAAPLRFSGDVANSAPITIVGPKGSIYLAEGCIVAAAHIHMSSKEANFLNVSDGELVTVQVQSVRPLLFQQVKVRVDERFRLEMHIDTDEGNAAFIEGNTVGEIVRLDGLVKSTSVQAISTAKSEKKRSTSAVFSGKVVSERVIEQWDEKEIVIGQKAIVTALASDLARKKEIKIVRQ